MFITKSASKPLSFRFILTATLLGNTLEWYDIVCFGFVAPLLIKLFFPTDTGFVQLFQLVIWFFFGSVLRPVGGFLFGFIGDRFGRRISLIVSVTFVTIPTLILGLLPTYQQIGFAAPALLSLMRLLQGMAVGGELPGAITFITESSSEKNRGFFGSFVFFGIFTGALLGGCDFFFLNYHLSEKAFAEWGWRFMFIIGSLLGFTSFFLRRKLHETGVFQHLREAHEITHDPLKKLFRSYKKPLVKAIGIYILETFASNLLLTFSMVYYVNILHMTPLMGALLTILFLVAVVITLPFAGQYASEYGPKKVALWALWGFVFLSVPLYWMMGQETLRILSPVLLGVLLAFYLAPLPAIMYKLFPANVRFSGIALGINLPMGILGGGDAAFVPDHHFEYEHNDSPCAYSYRRSNSGNSYFSNDLEPISLINFSRFVGSFEPLFDLNFGGQYTVVDFTPEI